jgi:hypothetical protein
MNFATDIVPTLTPEQYRLMRANSYLRLVSAKMHGGGSNADAISFFEARWGSDPHLDLVRKAAVNPGTTSEPSWAAPLAGIKPLTDAFVELARPASLLGKLQALSAVTAPFNVAVPVQTGGATFKWVSQGAALPVGNMQLTGPTLPILKAGGILVLTAELWKLATPVATTIVRNELIRGLAQYLDTGLTDPTNAGVSGEQPASITNGAPSIASAGTSAANLLTDLKALIATFIAANPNAASIALIMSPAVAAAAAVATGSESLTIDGGRLWGIPVVTSVAVGSRVILVDPSALVVADENGVDVSASTQGAVQMDTAPTSPPAAGSVFVPLWQNNLVGVKVIRFVNWRMARANAVLWTNVAYV